MGQIPTGRGFDSSIGYFQGMEDHYLHNFTACNNAIDLWDSYDPSPFNLTGTFGDYLYVDRAVNTIRKHDQSKPLFYYLALQVREVGVGASLACGGGGCARVSHFDQL